MRLISFQVCRYKNILDSTEVLVDPEVTALVGMNESGKSAMLDALYGLNPVYKDSFVIRDDYPRWRLKRDERKGEVAQISPIKATFQFDEDDYECLRSALGPGVVTVDRVTIGRYYNNRLWISIPVDEHRFLQNMLSGHPKADSLLKKHDTLASLKQSLKSESGFAVDSTVDDVSSNMASEDASVLAKIETLIGEEEDLNSIARRIIHNRMPKFFRFASYQILEGRVEVASLQHQESEHPGASSKQTARALLRLADMNLDVVTAEEFESQTAELEAVSNDLSREMAEYWSTNPELRIKVAVESVKSSTYGTSTGELYLNFRVEDRKHDFTNNFSRRSSGYQWFFSFLAAFSEFEDCDNVVILLDEPALTLHAKAQHDFLRFINDRLAQVGQVLYTTHSPFMIEQIERVRVVEDKGGEIGSVTSSDALEVGEDSAFPLQAALGYNLSQNLFIGERNLLVEGPSDFAYLDVISRYLHKRGREGIDEQWRILPAGGASNVPAFVSLLGKKISVTVLLDSGTEGVGKVEAAIKANKIASNRVVFVGSVLNQKHSDIEDLFAIEDYLELYNEAFGKTHKSSDLPNHPDRVVLRLENLDGKFDHWRPAELLLRDPLKVEKLSQSTLDNFEKLAKSINATHFGR